MFCTAFSSGGGYFMMPQQVWGQSDLICTPHGALENWAYPYKSQILKFLDMGVAIHPELCIEILRPKEKDLSELNLLFWRNSIDLKLVVA